MDETNVSEATSTELGNALFSYEMAYRDSVLGYLDEYRTIPKAFPYFVGLPLQRILVECLDGFVLARYPNEMDGFEVRPNTRETVLSAANILSMGQPPPAWPDFQGLQGTHVEIRNMAAGLDGLGNFLGPSPWHTILLSNSKDLRPWSDLAARAEASKEIHKYVSAHLMGIAAPGSVNQQAGFERASLATYQSAVESFRAIVEANPSEEPLQAFLTENPAILCLDAARVLPKFRLGAEWVTDFVLELASQQYVFVEIEAASHPLFTREKNPKKRKPSAELDIAVQQIDNWEDWMRRGFLSLEYHLPGIEVPEYWIVMGREPTDRSDRRKLLQKKRSLRPRQLLTYDDLLHKAERHLKVLRSSAIL